MGTTNGTGRDAHRTSGAMIAATTSAPARRARTVRRRRRMAMLGIGLGILRRRQFHEQVAIAVIGLAALARLTRDAQARTIARLIAWDKRQKLRAQRTAKPAQPSAR